MAVRQTQSLESLAQSQSNRHIGDEPRLTLILGGARSGKSRYAEEQITRRPAPWRYIATAQSFDAEMESRIAEHKRRRGEGWITTETPLDLAAVLQSIPATQPILVDCLTLWLTNVMLAEVDVDHAIQTFLLTLPQINGPCFLVSNEVGLGIVPDNALARAFRDHAGRLHQKLAVEADAVVFMVAGLPMKVK